MRALGIAFLILLVSNSTTYSQQKKDEKRPRLFNGGLIKRFEDLQTKIKKEREEKRKAREKKEAEKKKAEAEKKSREKQLKQAQRNSTVRGDQSRLQTARQDESDSSRRNEGLRLPQINASRLAPNSDPQSDSTSDKVELGLDVKPSGIGTPGLLVERIRRSGPAAAAGLQVRDRITSVGGSPIRKIDDLDLILSAFEPGDRTEIEFVRGGQKEKTLVEFPAQKQSGIASLNAPRSNNTEELPAPGANPRGAQKSDTPRPSTDQSIRVLPLVQGGAKAPNQSLNQSRAGIGVTAIAVDPTLFARQNLSVRQGAYLEVISKGSAAEKSGLKPGDVVIAVDGRKVDSAVSMAELIQTYQPGESAQLLYYRGNRLRRTEIVMDRIADVAPRNVRPELARNPNNRDPLGQPNRNSILGELSGEFPRLKRIDDMIERFSNQPNTGGTGSSVQYNRSRRELELENEVNSLRQRLQGQDQQIKDLNQKLNLIEKLLKKNQKR